MATCFYAATSSLRNAMAGWVAQIPDMPMADGVDVVKAKRHRIDRLDLESLID